MPSPITSLREARDFLSSLLDEPSHAAVIDALSANGEDLLDRWNAALGSDAYQIGDNVLACPAAGGEFMARVVAIRTDTDGVVLFTVQDQEDACFDLTLSELRPDLN